MTTDPDRGPARIADRLIEFCGALRAEGLAVGTSEVLDASNALESIGWEDEEGFREAVAATVAKSRGDREVFDLVFDRFFFRETEAEALRREPEVEGPDGIGDDRLADLSVEGLAEAVAEAIDSGDAGRMNDLARLSIEIFARDGERSGVVGVDLQRIRRGLGIAPGGEGTGPDPEGRREFERQLRRELERRQIGHLGKLPPARPLRDLNRTLPTRGAADLAQVQRAIFRMKRRLATVGHDPRRGGKGRSIDFRRTARASLETGGVPLDLRYRPRRPRKPEIYVLCDVSSSVSSASTFFLSVVHALHDSFRRLRSFVFIERISEVTDLFQSERDFASISERITAQGGVADVSGYTDYGRVWREFLEDVSSDLGPRSTVIVLGDARTNGRPPGSDSFRAVADRAKRTLWLNPEPAAYWNYGDSAMAAYAPFCDGVFECWTTDQLEDFVDLLARTGGGTPSVHPAATAPPRPRY
ncbi:MAG: VWA domain-containing protein [Solirubrobacterales bacterium]